jgi:hypothetical protein
VASPSSISSRWKRASDQRRAAGQGILRRQVHLHGHRAGTVKKTPLSDFSNPRKAGIIAVDLLDDDYLIGVELTTGQSDIVLVSDAGKAVWFDEEDVRPMGRGARGVRGMKLQEGQTVISLLVAESDQQTVLVATENGFGKRTVLADFRHSGRGTQGVKAIADSERNGVVIGAKLVDDNDEVMLITTGGVLIRTRVAEIRGMGRATQGVTLISLDDGEKLAGLEKVAESVAEAEAEVEGDVEVPESAMRHRVRAWLKQRRRRSLMSRIWNFSAGPAALPEEVLKQAQEEMLDWHGAGCSVMEMSHRGKEFMSIIDQAEADLRELMGIPSSTGAVPAGRGDAAVRADSDEPAGRPFGRLHRHRLVVEEGAEGSAAHRSSALRRDDRGEHFTRLPFADEIKLDPFAAYLHVCTNETIHGVEIPAERIADTGVPLVADMSSHILSRPVMSRNSA